jgi:hypothetical protein
MSALPKLIEDLLHEACAPIDKEDPELAAELREFSRQAYVVAWHARLSQVDVLNNHVAHEGVVWRNTARIAWEAERDRDPDRSCTLSDLRVACLTSFFHDLRPLIRITEESIIAEKASGASQADIGKLIGEKAAGREAHMKGSAADALRALEAHPELATEAERRRCVGYIAMHDLCKVGWPYPLSSDFLAVCCFEGDVLWPLDPQFGPLADLQRKGVMAPTRDQLKAQAFSNFSSQLVAYRASSFGCVVDTFRGGTIIRTEAGARILRESLRFWEIELPSGL